MALHAMAAMTGGLSACANPALLPEAIPVACRLAQDIFGRGASYVPEELPDLLLRIRDGKGTDALARALLPKASLTVTDESYDVTSYVSSSLFEVTQVMGTSSSRDGKAAVFYGLERLSQATESATLAFIHDGRGSVAQTILGGTVTSWKRYSAFGAVTAGTDPAEKPFFGYDAEEQDPLTGLTYLRARYYDPASARFGVADTYLGNTFDPITLNRYLYCASDPVNHVDPTGHYISFLPVTALSAYKLNRPRDPKHPNWYKKPGGTRINNDSYANLPGQRTVTTALISPNSSAALKAAHTAMNTNLADIGAAIRDGDYEGAKRMLGPAAATIDRFLELYCGNTKAMLTEVHEVTGAIAPYIFWVPIVGALNDLYYYSTEGNALMSILSTVLVIEEAATLGIGALATLGAKYTERIAIGAGVKEAAKDRVLSTAPGMGGKVTNVIMKGDLKITFKHGDRHLPDGADIDKIEEAIARDIASKDLDSIHQQKIRVTVDGKGYEYRPYVLDETNVNVGTYYLVD